MAKTTIGFGVALVVLGLGGFFGTGMQSWTALIPAGFGVVLAVLGWVSLAPQRRKHAMHVASAFALIGLLGAAPGAIKAIRWAGGTEPARPAAVVSQTIMAVLMAVFVGLCVRSFIDARRRRGDSAG